MGLFQALHPASRGSFCLLLDQGVEKEALPEFEVATAWTSVVVSLVFSRQTGFWVRASFFITLWSYLSPLYWAHGKTRRVLYSDLWVEKRHFLEPPNWRKGTDGLDSAWCPNDPSCTKCIFLLSQHVFIIQLELKLRHLACLWFPVGLPWKPCGCGWTAVGLWSKCERTFSKQQVRSHWCWILSECCITSVDDWTCSVKWKIYLSHGTLKRKHSTQKYVVDWELSNWRNPNLIFFCIFQ